MTASDCTNSTKNLLGGGVARAFYNIYIYIYIYIYTRLNPQPDGCGKDSNEAAASKQSYDIGIC